MKFTLLRNVKLGAVVMFLLFTFLLVTTVYAQDSAGIGLSPATIEEGAEPGQEKRYTVNISNLSGSDQLYYLSLRDIDNVRDGGVPEYADINAERSGYELTEWVTLDVSEVTVPAGGEVPVSFSMKVPDNATPGSHFGAIFVSVDPPKLRSTGAAVGYEVANIISIRVAGDAVESAAIRQFSTDRYIYGSTNVDFTLRIENTGTVLIRPNGPLEVHNMFGKRVALLDFNSSLAGVFPGTTREFSFNWKNEGTGFGRYEVRVSPVYGDKGSKNTISSTVSFWVLPMNIIGPALGVLVILFIAIYIGVKIYVRRTVAMMSIRGDRRIVRSNRRKGSPVFMLMFLSMTVTTVLFLIILMVLFA